MSSFAQSNVTSLLCIELVLQIKTTFRKDNFSQVEIIPNGHRKEFRLNNSVMQSKFFFSQNSKNHIYHNH